MVVMVALLRGINVGGRNKLPMANLRAYVTDAGYDQVSTYIQSGNVVFSSPEPDPGIVAAALTRLVAERADLTVEVIVRTAAEFVEIAEGNPFLARGEPAEHVHLACMDDATTATADAAAQLAEPGRYPPDEAVVVGSDMYLYLPEGTGRSKLVAALGRSKTPRFTIRNWRTVGKLVDMVNDVG